jgi:2-keto-3-deoxy-L-rhamnonate aldolase RhmA
MHQRLRLVAVLAAAVQVETKSCLESIDDVLEVPGITCAFLGG